LLVGEVYANPRVLLVMTEATLIVARCRCRVDIGRGMMTLPSPTDDDATEATLFVARCGCGDHMAVTPSCCESYQKPHAITMVWAHINL
jgi:hypothetical protein